jgi:transcriptional regulator with XRE-family HTH domain
MKNNGYNPSALLDAVREKLDLKNDAALARALEVAPPLLSRIRHNKLPVGATLLVAIHELTGVPTRDLRALMGDQPVQQEEPVLPIQPGHVMSKKSYERLVREQQK